MLQMKPIHVGRGSPMLRWTPKARAQSIGRNGCQSVCKPCHLKHGLQLTKYKETSLLSNLKITRRFTDQQLLQPCLNSYQTSASYARMKELKEISAFVNWRFWEAETDPRIREQKSESMAIGFGLTPERPTFQPAFPPSATGPLNRSKNSDPNTPAP